jgi:hypothetical protein
MVIQAMYFGFPVAMRRTRFNDACRIERAGETSYFHIIRRGEIIGLAGGKQTFPAVVNGKARRLTVEVVDGVVSYS